MYMYVLVLININRDQNLNNPALIVMYNQPTQRIPSTPTCVDVLYVRIRYTAAKIKRELSAVGEGIM